MSADAETLARRTEMYARLDAISLEREAAKEFRRETEGVMRANEESLAEFLKAFEAQRAAVAAGAAALRAEGPAETPARRDACKAALAALSVQCAHMQHDTAQAAFFLPPYELRKAHKAVAQARELIEAVRAEVIPKQRFSFDKARERRAARLAAKAAAAELAAPGSSSTAAAQGKTPTILEVADLSATTSEYCIHRRSDETIIVRAGELGGRDLWLSHLTRCRIYVADWMRGARIDHLEGCEVYLGPVAGSCHIDTLTDCRLHLASRQIRIHHAQRCDFFLLVLSNPIIEHTTAVRFGPYDFSFPDRDAVLHRAELGDQRLNRWCEVNDFGWLRVQQSPNWCVVPEGERSGLRGLLPE